MLEGKIALVTGASSGIGLAVARAVVAGGAVVNVASRGGMVPVPHEAAYSASKAGLRAFSRVLQGELRPRAIHVGIVSPGPVDTSFFGDLAKAPALNFSQPMSTAEEVADAVLRCWRERRVEIALPWLSGKLCTLGYLSPRFMRLLRPALERRGERNKRALMERRAARKS